MFEEPIRKRGMASLTPLIDVVFILLLFFMLASNFQQWRSLTLNAPGQGSAAPNNAERALLIRLSANGVLDLNGQALTLDQLDARLQPYLTRNPDQAVIVQPEVDVALQTLVAVFDRLAAVGVGQLTLSER